MRFWRMKAVISQWCGLIALQIMTLSQSPKFRHVKRTLL
jgi:hypothetical protein